MEADPPVHRVVHFLRALSARIGPNEDPGEIQQVLEAALHALFENAAAPPGPEVHIEVHSHDGDAHAHLTLRPRRFLGVQMEEISLGLPLG